MKKITRTYRLDADLVERFNKASDITGIDKTTIIESAILGFCEKVERGEIPEVKKEFARINFRIERGDDLD